MSLQLPSVDDRLLSFDASGRPTLHGARDRSTGRLVFPPPADDSRFERTALPRDGQLWSWTVQRFRPKSPPYAGPEQFRPYAVGYVALGDAIIVEARLTGAPLDGYAIGMPMTLVGEAFERADGTACTTFAFAPSGPSA
nr:OB-fold domain-containing protein [uncultured Sphingomonas sp.]